jgi:hypothetical protein
MHHRLIWSGPLVWFIGLAMYYTNSNSRRYLRWLVFGSSTYEVVRLRRLNPRRLGFILDLKLVLHEVLNFLTEPDKA